MFQLFPFSFRVLLIHTLGFFLVACGSPSSPNQDSTPSSSSEDPSSFSVDPSSPSTERTPSDLDQNQGGSPLSAAESAQNEDPPPLEAPEDQAAEGGATTRDETEEETEPDSEQGTQEETEQESEQETEQRDELIPFTPQANHLLSLTDRIVGNPTQRRYGIAISDLDLNGDYEVIVTGYGAPNEVYDYQEGSWIDTAPDFIKDPMRRAIGVAACDVDGDGQEEIYFLNVDRFGGLGEVSDRLYMRTEGGGWEDVFEREENRSVINQFSGRSVACLDRLGQGRYGVFVANYGGPMKLFELNEEGRLLDVGQEVGINLTTGGRALLSLPRQEPGMHLFAGNENGANFLFINRGGTFEEKARDAGITDAQETVRGAATLDANEDGLFDLVYGNWDGPHRLFIAQPPNDESGFITYTNQASPEMSIPSRIRTVIAADLDNDGYEELFFNNIGQPNRLFRQREGQWIQVPLEEALEPEGLGTGAAVVDSNQDGILELWIAHGESGAQPLSVYQWGNQGYHWLRVAPLTSTGAPARGAQVDLYQRNGRIQRRVIDAGSGYLCQMEPVAHFGLGEQTEIERIVVKWVDGHQVELMNPTLDQLLRVSPDRAQ